MKIKSIQDHTHSCIKAGTLIGSLFIGAHAYAATVESMSLEEFIEAEQSYWRVSVQCENVAQPRTIQKPIAGDTWCASDAPTVCNENKFTASRMVCADNFTQKVVNGDSTKVSIDSAPNVDATLSSDTAAVEAASEPTVSSTTAPEPIEPLMTEAKKLSKTDLLKEQNQIESQRILIQQKRLELQRRELELKKAQMNGQ